MKFCIMRKAFSWNERFGVCDEHGNELYAVEGELLAMSKRLHVYDRQGDEAICIAHRSFAFPPGYELFVRGDRVGRLIRRMSVGCPAYDIVGTDWTVKGDFWQHDYEIAGPDGVIAVIRREWLQWGGCYSVSVDDESLALIALSVALVIDCVAAQSV